MLTTKITSSANLRLFKNFPSSLIPLSSQFSLERISSSPLLKILGNSGSPKYKQSCFEKTFMNCDEIITIFTLNDNIFQTVISITLQCIFKEKVKTNLRHILYINHSPGFFIQFCWFMINGSCIRAENVQICNVCTVWDARDGWIMEIMHVDRVIFNHIIFTVSIKNEVKLWNCTFCVMCNTFYYTFCNIVMNMNKQMPIITVSY